MPIFGLIRRAIEYLLQFLTHIAMWGVFALMLLVVTDVTLRALFGTSTFIAEEVGGYLLVLIAYLAMAETLKKDRHIRVDIFVRRLSRRFRAWLDVVLSFIGLTALTVVIWRVFIMVYSSYSRDVLIPGVLLTPVYLPQTPMIIGLGALALQCVADLLHTIHTMRQTSAGVPTKPGGEVSQE